MAAENDPPYAITHNYYGDKIMTFKDTSTRLSRRRVIRTLAAIMAAPVLYAALSGPAQAQSVDDIKRKGKVVVGIQGDNAPWGYVDSQGKQLGFDADVAKLLAKELGVQVEFVQLAVANRIPALTAGKVDVLVAVMGMYPDRAKAVQFSKPYSDNRVVLIAAKATPIKTVQDMSKIIIGVPRASAQDTQVTKSAPAGTEIRRFDDDAANIQALLSGQVQAVGANAFYVQRLNATSPGAYEVKLDFVRQWNGICTRQGQKEWNAFINRFIDKIRSNGELATIYQKWMGNAPPADFPEKLEGIPFAVN
ncbi:transporter substrate-binding domain-containing protein [Cupriavidus sp. CV2]|uniref:transporter substrate-binding domain-containing protein n=1 Tax=Cupriavidus ulmosensis TaxID=3065913 RepID=UPI00296AC9A1|nr:transporter substrate-binding domain-containing protein [Cupriavidus sp. CV2]MDW3686007.1 transporter substrate-binding domain-containing protein [Cupriavidus sp. CV2]